MRLGTFGGLWMEREGGGERLELRPRLLALLAIVAAAGKKGVSRDRVLAILWPDTDEDRGRHALSQTLYNLRQDLGRDVVVAGVNLSLDPAELGSDVDELRRAIAGSDWARAAEVYGGPFLDGFYLAEGPDFERWVEVERARLAKDGHASLESAARQSTSEGRLDLAAGHWRRLTLADPLSSRYGLGYMEALVALGDRAGALAHAQAHTELVRRELEAAPDLPITRLVDQLKRPAPEPQPPVQTRAFDRRAPSTTVPETSVQPAPLPPALAPFWRRIRRSAPALGVAVLALAALVWAWRGRTSGPVSPPTLAVGQIRDLASPDSARLGGVLSDMLTTDLGRLTRLDVIATSRLLELMPWGSDTTPGARSAAARRAGAQEIIEGEITVTPTGQLELDLRRVALQSGRVRGAYRVLAMDRHALIDSATAALGADFRLAVPAGSLADVTTRSPIAYRLYEEGLRAFYQGDPGAALRLFRAALAADSSFALAAYHGYRAAVAVGDTGVVGLATHALQVAARATDRDRLLIRAHLGADQSDPAAVFAAESLIARYPNDPEALTRGAVVFSNDVGRLPLVTTLLDRVIREDSAAGSGQTGPCRLCEALTALTTIYVWADSAAALERVYRRWLALRPRDGFAWHGLAGALWWLGQQAQSDQAVRQGDALGASDANPITRVLVRGLQHDELTGIDDLCRSGLASANPDNPGRVPLVLHPRLANRRTLPGRGSADARGPCH